MNEIQRESNEARAVATARESNDSLTESQRLAADSSKSRQIASSFACLLRCGLCSTVHIRIVTLVMTLCFCVSSLVFHGLTLSSKNFDINIFAYIIVGGLAEVPAYSLSAVIVDKFGRRKPLSICFFVCGVSLVAIVVSPQDITWLIMLLAMVGKLGIASAGQMIYLYLSELYPTEYRLQGMGVAILAQRLGSMMGPVIISVISPLSWWGPSAVMGAVTLLASVATLALPETLGAVLPDTLGDLAELFANKNRKKNKASNGESTDMAEESKPMRT
ncbi:organic cation/carnitine transporter 2-like [Macrobrachium nipponense]|uniref:organic cation/carnitine transporter 2-like n=1 Tax=Macrobrachium nipponense TaxID=159736 RepID=UPI0030C832F3